MNRFVSALFVSFALLATALDADAARRKPAKKKAPKGKLVQPNDLFSVPVNVGKKRHSVQCLGETPGQAKNTAKGLMFNSYANLAKREKNAKRRNLFRQLAGGGKKECKTPDFLALQRYTGRFGEEEARRLYEVFAFGGTPEEISAAAARGLDATVNSLLAFQHDPTLEEGIRGELYCDGVLPGYFGETVEDNETCEPDDMNAVYFPGVRYYEYYRTLYGPNPFHAKLWMFLHDERMSASADVLSGCEAHALPAYVKMLHRATISGDFMQLMRESNSDHLVHLQYLDGARNRGFSPNENYAREFWELGTVGPTARDGSPVYTDQDIAQSALAFSGWSIESFERFDRWVCLKAYVPDNHAPYAKTIFAGTRHAATVYNDEDVLRATFAHPRTAEHLAEDLWKEFINPFPTTNAIQQLAGVIRQNNYNLIPVMRTIMQSRAFYAARSRKSLIKHPADLLLGFLRTTGIPIHYRDIDWYLSQMGQRPTLPPSVFGWNERRYTDEAHVQDWRNVALSILTRSDDSFEDQNYTLHDRFLTGLPGNEGDSRNTIRRLSNWLNVTLNETQIAKLDEYMNYNMERCFNNCNGQQYVLRRDAFDAHPEGNWNYKLRGAMAIMVMLPDYIMK